MWYPRGKSSFLLSSHHGMYMCMPPTPSSLCGGMSSSLGMKPDTARPVESVRFFPSWLLEFDRPFGCRDDFELSISRADSHALAARTTAFERTVYSRPSAVFTYEKPVALPFSSGTTSRAISPVMIVSLPVFTAGGRNTDVDEKFECVMQPRPHWPQ